MIDASPTQSDAANGVGAVTSVYEETIRDAIARLDIGALARRFREQNEFIFLERFLPEAAVAAMTGEALRLIPRAYRTRVPWVRKAGTVGQTPIANEAPFLNALYHSPSFIAFAEELCGVSLMVKHERDAHAAALYVYKRQGDHVGWHYDDCGCEGAASYTSTVGLINDSKSVVHFQLWKDHPTEKPQDLLLPAVPGSLAFFCGSKVYHKVTPLQDGEERVVYSFAHVTAGKRLTGLPRLKENFWDALLYFGPKAIFQRNY